MAARVASSLETVLVTGSAGFLGARVVSALRRSNYRVVGLDIVKQGNDLETIHADLRDGDRLFGLLRHEHVQHIIHLAAVHLIPACEADPEGAFETNVTGSQNLLKLGEQLRVRSFTFTSSADVYAPSGRPHSEADPLGSPNVYGRSKAMAETILQQWSLFNDCTVRILRLFNLVGVGDRNPHLIPEMLRQLEVGSGVRAGRLDTVRDYVSVDDVSELIVGLLHHHESMTINVGNGQGYSGIDVLATLAKVRGRRYALEIDPARLRANDRPTLVANRGRLDRLVAFPTRSLGQLLAWAEADRPLQRLEG